MISFFLALPSPPPPYAMWLLTLASIYHCIYMFRYNIFCFWGILSHCGILVFWSLFSLGQSWTLNSPWATQPPTTYPPPRASDWSMRISQASDWSKGGKYGPKDVYWTEIWISNIITGHLALAEHFWPQFCFKYVGWSVGVHTAVARTQSGIEQEYWHERWPCSHLL